MERNYEGFKQFLNKYFNDKLKSAAFCDGKPMMLIELDSLNEDEVEDKVYELNLMANTDGSMEGLNFHVKDENSIWVEGWLITAFFIQKNLDLKIELIQKDDYGKSILLKCQNTGFQMWVDIHDERWDFNQFVFNLANSKDCILREIQNSEEIYDAVWNVIEEEIV